MIFACENVFGRTQACENMGKGKHFLSLFASDFISFLFKENEEVFKVKKSSYSKKIVKLLKKEYKEDLEKSKIKTELSTAVDSKY